MSLFTFSLSWEDQCHYFDLSIQRTTAVGEWLTGGGYNEYECSDARMANLLTCICFVLIVSPILLMADKNLQRWVGIMLLFFCH